RRSGRRRSPLAVAGEWPWRSGLRLAAPRSPAPPAGLRLARLGVGHQDLLRLDLLAGLPPGVLLRVIEAAGAQSHVLPSALLERAPEAVLDRGHPISRFKSNLQ